jgi:hypothetical protein
VKFKTEKRRELKRYRKTRRWKKNRAIKIKERYAIRILLYGKSA